MPRSLKNDLAHLRKKERLSLHMPGHKGLRLREDTTELALTDNLLHPQGSILELEKAIARIYGAKWSYVGTNGSTSFLLGSLFYAGKGQKIVLPRASHQSIYKGLILGNHQPIYLENSIDELGIARPLKTEDYLKALNKGGKTYIFTVPSYEGYLEDYKILKPFLKDSLTIVDAAHGSHLYYLKLEDNSWADLKVISFHKTLGALNPGAAILSNLEEDKREELNFFQTSSPSFPVLLSIEDSLREMMKMKIAEKLRLMTWLKEEIGKIGDLRVVANDDPFKLLISSVSGEMDFKKLGEFLRKEAGVFMEIESQGYLLGILSFYDSHEGYKTLIKALKKSTRIDFKTKTHKSLQGKSHLPQISLLPGEAFLQEKKLVPVKEALGKISGVMYSKYPPGAPLLVPGEIIDEKIIEELLTETGDHTGCSVIKDGSIFIIK